MKRNRKKYLLLILFLAIIFIVSILFCYLNDTIFSSIALSYIKQKSFSKEQKKYSSLPVFIQRRLFNCQINNLSNSNPHKRMEALNFIRALCKKHPEWRKYTVIGLLEENNSHVMFSRVDILVNGQTGVLVLSLSEKTALQYQRYLKYALNYGIDKGYTSIIMESLKGLSSAYRNDEKKFRKYILPLCDNEYEYVRISAYINIRYFETIKDWRKIFKKKLKTEKSPTVKKAILALLKRKEKDSPLFYKEEDF